MRISRSARILLCLIVIAASLTLRSSGHRVDDDVFVPPVARLIADRPDQLYAHLPMAFERNVGQTDPRVSFLSRGRGYGVFLKPTEAVIASGEALIRMTFLGASSLQETRAFDPLPGKANYFVGPDPSQWRTDIPTYAKVQFAEVYPGVDVVYYGNQHQLEYDFVVAPGADPDRIRLRFDGTASRIDDDGTLIVRSGAYELRQKKPIIYQEVGGRRRPVRGGFTRNRNGEVGFQVDAYDRKKPLIIDPVIVYSTYLGGSTPAASFSAGRVIAVGSDRGMYVAGTTTAVDFPTADAVQGSNAGDADLFVAKISADGSAVVFATYFGGSSSEGPLTLALDGAENVYVHGGTVSGDFPTTPGAFRTSGGGAFVIKLHSQGNALIYSTLALGEAAAVDAAGNVYLIGETNSASFVFSNPLQPTLAGGFDAIVARLSPDGSELVYLTYLGGSGDDAGRGIAVDVLGDLYLVGFTKSTDFPTLGPIQAAYAGGTYYGDCWVARMRSDGSALSYSTYLGGSDDDVCERVAVDAQRHAHIAGQTSSFDFPVLRAFQPLHRGPRDGIAAKIDQTGSSLIYATYLGGSSDDFALAIAADGSGHSYVTGATSSPDFPTYRPLQSHLGAAWGAFVAKMDPIGAPIYSTYLDGGSEESATVAIATDADGNAYVTGYTASADFPTTRPLQPTLAGAVDAIVVKIADPPCPQDVTNQVEVIRFPFYDVLFGLFRFQWVIIHNKTSAPIAGPVAFVMSDLQNAIFIGSPLKTRCFSPEGDPFMIVPVGSDNVLGPNESALTGIWLLRTRADPVTYTPRALAGLPLQ